MSCHASTVTPNCILPLDCMRNKQRHSSRSTPYHTTTHHTVAHHSTVHQSTPQHIMARSTKFYAMIKLDVISTLAFRTCTTGPVHSKCQKPGSGPSFLDGLRANIYTTVLLSPAQPRVVYHPADPGTVPSIGLNGLLMFSISCSYNKRTFTVGNQHYLNNNPPPCVSANL